MSRTIRCRLRAANAREAPPRCVVIALAVSLSLWLAACSSGGGGSARTPTTVGSPTQAASATAPAAPTLTPASASPIATPTPSALVPQTLAGYYTISVPPNWTTEDIAVPGGVIRRYVLTEDGTRKAQLQVQCRPGASIDAMTASTKQTAEGLGGQWAIGGTKLVTVAGLPGVQTDYDIPAVANQETRAVYLKGARCGWQLALQSFGVRSRARYASLFEQILATFAPAMPGG